MKASLIYLVVGLSTIVAQTTILRLPFFHEAVCDLMIPLMVFLSLDRPNRQGMSVAFILGLVMDLMSGGVFGLYLSVYFWIFFSARGLSKYFDVGQSMFQSILIGLFVAGEQMVFWLSTAPPWPATQLLTGRLSPIVLQTIFGALTGPGILMFLRRLQTRFGPGPVMIRRESGELGRP
jgi:rod shape-determining protein MreD